MEHKPLVERLWGIVRTHSFFVFESALREACPDGSLQALAGALRHLGDAGQHGLAQELLGESLRNHVASPQILWRLELVLLFGRSGAGGAAGVEDLAAFEKRVKELVRAERLDDAIALVSAAAGTGASPALYELLGRLYLSRAAEPAPVAAAPAPKAVAAPLEKAVAEAKAEAAPAPAAPTPVAPAPVRSLPAQAAPAAEAQRAPAAPVEPARPAAPAAASRPAIQPPAPRPEAGSAEKPTGERSAPASWVAEELLKARARAQEAKLKNSGEPAPAPARAEAVARAVPPAAAAEAKPQPAPVELPGADEPKEQVFARLREAFAKLGKIERKVLAWVMANPNQNAAQIARSTELGNAEVASALKGLTGLWLDPFTFAGYSVRDYVMECMSKGKQAPAPARQSASAAASARATAPSPVRSIEPPRPASPASPAPRAAEPAPAAAKPARAAGGAPAVVSLPAGMSGLDLRVLRYIDGHPGCSPNEVMDAMGPDEPASVSLVTLRREWLDRDAEGRYRIKPDMQARIPGNAQPEAPVAEAAEVRAAVAEPAPRRPSELERSSLLASAPSAARPASKEAAKLAKLPKGQRQILEFLRDNGKARSKDIANALDQEVAKVNAALLGALADYVSVMHSFWRLNEEAAAALEPAETAEAS